MLRKVTIQELAENADDIIGSLDDEVSVVVETAGGRQAYLISEENFNALQELNEVTDMFQEMIETGEFDEEAFANFLEDEDMMPKPANED